MMLCMAFTNKCILECKSCLNNSGPAGEYGLSTEILEQVLGWLAKQETPQVDFSGGEPFARRDVRDLIRLAKQLNIQVNVCSNGCSVDDEIVELLANVRRVTITFYGPEKFHDQTTLVPGSYKKALRALTLLKGTQTRLRANVVILAGAVDDAPGLVEELHEAGASEIKFSLALPIGRAADLVSQLISREEGENLIQSIRMLGDLQHIPVIVQNLEQLAFSCEILQRGSLFLTHDGRIYPCPLFRSLDFEIGHITDTQSVCAEMEKIDWDKALACVARLGENCCPAVAMGLFKHMPGVVVHQGCPPMVERI